ncbi:DUF6299 family protein [Streptomyces roseicoloratus]|uniref:DUF6299 family protein n=1 Tax=Streptomyces roseicoloratus TaxID=2508722 RepID=A0ABY9S029_9ACTN|nr:DUF6299 family protein [Streptomyces roseicoloratus]WMX47784.1 DUF6299 family protein [Streptomyces roseicoloratus]
MRARLVLAGALLATAAATAPTAHAGAGDGLSVTPRGTLAEDGTVTLSGSYRCLDDTAGPVFVSSTLVQDDRSAGIGGTRAVCDGRVHAWTNSAVVKEPGYRPGAARVEATLMQLTTQGPLGLPLPGFLAAEESAVTLG